MSVSQLQGRVDGPFSDDDLRFWADNGYVVLHDACPPENLQAVVDDIMAFLDMDQHDPESWYHLADVPEGEKLPHVSAAAPFASLEASGRSCRTECGRDGRDVPDAVALGQPPVPAHLPSLRPDLGLRV